MIARETVVLPPFAREVEEGLSAFQKTLPCKLFYDAYGSELFEEITRLPEYYLTRTELAILRERGSEIVAAAGSNLSVVELGAGTAVKTGTLLGALARRQMRVPFYAVDISSDALESACERIASECPTVFVKPIVADFSQGFGFLRTIRGQKLVLYLGSSIGNFNPEEAMEMLLQVRRQLAPGDALLLGTDLAKDPAVLVPAYDDAQGVTAEFNKNILRRLNRDLQGDFDLDAFRHRALWNPRRSRMEIYLESLKDQTVTLGLLRQRVGFRAGERIHTENSYKYTLTMVREMLEGAGFRLEQSWFDECKWFGLHLARV
ncbi:MAG TPA: L-histidine N(alpha)-methyltransferase [Terriglobales bacterium]|nr:L-histidine N(alpha)-methyltransferase [Terriglobales bacterium]